MLFIGANIFLALCFPALIYRIIVGPNWLDRIIAVDLLSIYLIGVLLSLQVELGWRWDQDVVWVLVTLGFVNVLATSLLLSGEKNVR